MVIMQKILLLVFLMLAAGCVGGKQPEKLPIEENTASALADIALKASDFTESGWVQGKTNASEDVYTVVFFKTGFAYGEISSVENRVHLYQNASEADRDFSEAVIKLNETFILENSTVGRKSVYWEKGDSAYILFKKKNINVELYLKSAGSYDIEFLKNLAKKIEERI